MMSISTYYRGRLSFNEVINMPIEYIHSLNYIMYKHKDDKDHKQLKEAEALEDNIEEIM